MNYLGASLELRGASLELRGASLELLGASLELGCPPLNYFGPHLNYDGAAALERHDLLLLGSGATCCHLCTTSAKEGD